MQSHATLLALLLGAALAAALAWLGLAGAAQLTARQRHGYLHAVFYILVMLLGLGTALSGRDLTTNHLLQELLGMGPPPTKPPLLARLQPVASLLLLALSGERLLTHMLLRREEAAGPGRLLLLAAFMLFWLGSTASPALLGAHPQLSHDYLYPLVMGLAASLATPRELDLAVRATRNALLLLMLAGLLLVPLRPTLVMDMAYGQGLIPGLARFAGLASHPVSMGLLAQIALLCLLARPFARRWLQRSAWALGLTVLVLAQSKTAWLAFALCSATLLLWRHGPGLRQRLADPLRPHASMALVLLAMAGVALLMLLGMFGQLGERMARFFGTPEGAQLASLTGRDRIWAIAWEQWALHPVFGYGPPLWDAAFRQAVGIPSATHAHNQFMDTLSRAGLVGATALVLYALVLVALAWRGARASQGLTLALCLALALRAVSEVPLMLLGYGPELITHLLLLMALAAACAPAASRPANLSAAGASTLSPRP